MRRRWAGGLVVAGAFAATSAALAAAAEDLLVEKLNVIWSLDPVKAAREAQRLATEGVGDANQRFTAAFLAAAALERAGHGEEARSVYLSVASDGPVSVWTHSARFRLRMLSASGASARDREQLYEKLAREADAPGWFLVAGQWRADTTRRAALHALNELRGDRLSIRAFGFIRAHSPFPPPYAYLFVLLAMTMAVKGLALPFLWRTSVFEARLRPLRWLVEDLQQRYSDNPMQLQQEMAQLYRRHGLDPWSGCAVALLDLIFVVFALLTLRAFTPQLILDGARLPGVLDVTRFDAKVLVVWMVINGVSFFLFSRTMAPPGSSKAVLFVSWLLMGGIVGAVAWKWEWPAYVFVFWLLLGIVGLFIRYILRWTTAWTVRS